ncbi:MAG: superoxide dismutase family protein [Gemmatimonadales bacterium]|nr:superoxide dismutase family protein [Gemmatimonadales bacterium]
MRNHRALALLTWSAALTACSPAERDRPASDTTATAAPMDSPDPTIDTPPAPLTATQASASMRSAAGRNLGQLLLTAGQQGITIRGRLTGLPGGVHAIHLHAAGRCDPPKFESAGDHWNPTNRQHGTESAQGPHLGDLPNLDVSQDGSVAVQAAIPGVTLRGGDTQVLDGDGAAVVVHARPDDYKSQPSGDAGDRIACGVVTGS